MTEDINLAALPEGGFLDPLKQTGLPFHEVPTLKRGAPSTSFKVRGRKLSVDLLVPARSAPYRPVPLHALGAHAIGLPYLSYLLKETVQSVLIGRGRMVPINVPHAGWFCLHKLALYSLRAGMDNPKREKDVFQAAALAAALAREQDFRVTEAIEGMDEALRKRVKTRRATGACVSRGRSPGSGANHGNADLTCGIESAPVPQCTERRSN